MKVECSVPGCESPRRKRDWCQSHYQRWARHGDPTGGGAQRLPFANAAERFWAKVDRSAGASACWPWTGSCGLTGYGRFQWRAISKAPLTASRVAYFLTHDEWPAVVRHTCDNPPCCNPAHLLPGTQGENNRDKIERGRQRVRRLLSDEDVVVIRTRVAAGETQARLAAEFEIDNSTVSLIVARKTYRSVA